VKTIFDFLIFGLGISNLRQELGGLNGREPSLYLLPSYEITKSSFLDRSIFEQRIGPQEAKSEGRTAGALRKIDDPKTAIRSGNQNRPASRSNSTVPLTRFWNYAALLVRVLGRGKEIL
jgi:hypothetical protein